MENKIYVLHSQQQCYETFMLILLAPLNGNIPHICGFS